MVNIFFSRWILTKRKCDQASENFLKGLKEHEYKSNGG
jgi:hypothetical protein